MSHQEIIKILSDKNSDSNKLYLALFIVRIRIEYCIENDIELHNDSLLSKVLIFR